MKPTQALFGLSAIKLAKYSLASGLLSPRDKLVTRALVLLLLASTFGLTAGCTMLRVGIGGAGKPSAQPHLVEEQLELQRFADDFIARGGQALDESAERLRTDAGREQVLRIKLLLGSSVLSIVSGPNPNANLLDMVSVTVLTRLSIQHYWMHTTNGAAFQPWLDATHVLETNVWDLAARSLPPAQVAELRTGINVWYARTPEVRTAFFARPHAFAYMVRTMREEGAPSTSGVFTLVNLDPIAELDPAVREVTQTRLLAERAMYTAQRMPFLLRLQGEVLGYDLAEEPAPRQIVSNSTQLSDSVQRISAVAASLNQTIGQLPDRIAEERKKILAAIESQEGKNLVAGVDHALVSGEKLSNSLNITLTNLTRLMKLLRVGEPKANERPFDILDYAQTVKEVGVTTQNLKALIGSVNQSAPEIQRLSWEASANLQKEVDRTFRLGLLLIAVLLTGAVLAGLVYTFFAEKIKRRAAAGSGQS